MTGFQSETGEEKLQIPLDLSEWCERKSLLTWIQEEVETLDWSNPELTAYLRLHPTYQPKAMLSLLTLAYATGTFESEEIVRLCHGDETFRGLAQGSDLSPSELGRFRRENRGLLKWGLNEILKRALREKFALGNDLLPAGLRHLLTETASVRLDIARHVDRAAF